MENAPSIIFPHLGIEIPYFANSFSIGKFSIAFYGVIIAIAMILVVLLILRRAGKTNQCKDDYVDIAITVIIFGIIGARLYYVLFNLEYYLANPMEIINIRGGGLAIYGGLIGAVISGLVCCKIKKLNFLRVIDTAFPYVALAQAIGRWANFVNREAFGEYTDSLFAMRLRLSEVNTDAVTELMQQNMITENGVSYIQVSPTFLYESVWSLVVFAAIMIFRRFQRYNGEAAVWYVGGYALGRAWIEGLRTDALYIGHTGIAASQLLSVGLAAGAVAILLINRVRLARKTWEPVFSLVLTEGDVGTTSFAEARKAARKAAKADKYKETHGEEKKNATDWETGVVSKIEAEEAAEEVPQEKEAQEVLSEAEEMQEAEVIDAKAEAKAEADATEEPTEDTVS